MFVVYFRKILPVPKMCIHVTASLGELVINSALVYRDEPSSCVWLIPGTDE